MKRTFIKLVSLMLILLVFFISIPAIAQVRPAMTVTMPGTIQVEVDEDFLIPITITSSDHELRIGWIVTTIETPGVEIRSRHIDQTVSALSSFNVPLTGTAFSEEGFFRVIIDVYADAALYGSVRVSNEVLIEVVDEEDEQRSEFKITNVSFLPPAPDLGSIFSLIIDIENFGEKDSGKVTAILDGGVNFYNEHITNRVILPSVEPNGSARAAFRIRARDTRVSNEVTLTLIYDNHTQSETVFLPLPEAPDARLAPSVKVSAFTVERTGEDRFVLRLTAVNEGEERARSINASLDGGDRVFVVEGGNVRSIGSLDPKTDIQTEFLLTSRGELNNHAVNLSFEFYDEDGVKHSSADRIFISSDLEPELRVAGFSARPLEGDEEFSLDISFKNDGHSLARDISVRFTGTQAMPLNDSILLDIADIEAGKTGRASLRMKALGELETYAVPFEVTYKSRSGGEHSLNDTIMLSADLIGIETDEEYEGLPSLMLDRHSISVDRVFAGTSFTLSLYIKNTSDEEVGNTRLTIGSVQAAGAGARTIFSPADNRTSFFIESIPPQGEQMKEITLFTDRNADEMTYELPIKIQYEDEDGKLSSVSETVIIPVLREGELRVLSLEFPQTVAFGEELPISLELANTGRSVLRNVLVSLEADIPIENGTHFIPTLEPGTNEFFYATINPEAVGEMTADIIITFTDSADREQRLEQPLSFDVLPQASAIPAMSRNAAASPIVIGGGILAIILVIIGFIVVRRMKNKRKAEAFSK